MNLLVIMKKEKRSLQCLYLLVLCAPQQNLHPSFAAVANMGTDGITQVPFCSSPALPGPQFLFGHCKSPVFNSDHKHMTGNELQKFRHWSHKESFSDRQQIGCCNHWSVWYIQPHTLGWAFQLHWWQPACPYTDARKTSLVMSPFP